MLTSTLPHHLVVIDCETTGLGSNDRIIEIAVLTLDPRTWEPTDEYETLINPERDVGPVDIHGITASMVEAAPTFPEIITTLAHRLHGAILIAHNLSFDARMLGYEFKRRGVDFDAGSGLCTYRATGSKLNYRMSQIRNNTQQPAPGTRRRPRDRGPGPKDICQRRDQPRRGNGWARAPRWCWLTPAARW